jgi:hypothetical protein
MDYIKMQETIDEKLTLLAKGFNSSAYEILENYKQKLNDFKNHNENYKENLSKFMVKAYLSAAGDIADRCIDNCCMRDFYISTDQNAHNFFFDIITGKSA